MVAEFRPGILLTGFTICLAGLPGLIIPGAGFLTTFAGVASALWISGFAVMTLLCPHEDPGHWETILGSILISLTILTLIALACETAGVRAFEAEDGYAVSAPFTGGVILTAGVLTLGAGILRIPRPYHLPELTGITPRVREILPATLIMIGCCGLLAGLMYIPVMLPPEPSAEIWLLHTDGRAGGYQLTGVPGGTFSAMVGIKASPHESRNLMLVVRENNDRVSWQRINLPDSGFTLHPFTVRNLTGRPGEVVLITAELSLNTSSGKGPDRRVSLPVRLQ